MSLSVTELSSRIRLPSVNPSRCANATTRVLIKRTVREFAEKEIGPRAEEIDTRDEFPADLFHRMAEMGILGIPFAESYSGSGGDYISLLIALEEIARVSGSMASFTAARKQRLVTQGWSA